MDGCKEDQECWDLIFTKSTIRFAGFVIDNVNPGGGKQDRGGNRTG